MAIHTVALATPAAYPAAASPNVVCPFTPRQFAIINEDPTAANTVSVSFDNGVTDHVVLIPGTLPGIVIEQQVRQFHVKGVAGAPVRIIFNDQGA